MGTATSIIFESTGSGNAAISGEFTKRAREANDVIKALRSNGIEFPHGHMLEEEPRLLLCTFGQTMTQSSLPVDYVPLWTKPIRPNSSTAEILPGRHCLIPLRYTCPGLAC
jgi:hypothetical protein